MKTPHQLAQTHSQIVLVIKKPTRETLGGGFRASITHKKGWPRHSGVFLVLETQRKGARNFMWLQPTRLFWVGTAQSDALVGRCGNPMWAIKAPGYR